MRTATKINATEVDQILIRFVLLSGSCLVTGIIAADVKVYLFIFVHTDRLMMAASDQIETLFTQLARRSTATLNGICLGYFYNEKKKSNMIYTVRRR